MDQPQVTCMENIHRVTSQDTSPINEKQIIKDKKKIEYINTIYSMKENEIIKK